MRSLSIMVGMVGAIALCSPSSAQILDNQFSEYFERGVTINPGAGNAKDANAAIHTIDPWPPYAGDTRIPGDGRSVICALTKMYRTPDPFFSPLSSGGTGSTGTAPVGGNVSIGNSNTTVNSGAEGGSSQGISEISGCY